MLGPGRKRLCQFCEGSVAQDATFCPYCGNELDKIEAMPARPREEEHHKRLEDSLTSLYRPPYAAPSSTAVPRYEETNPVQMNQIFQPDEHTTGEAKEDAPAQMTEADWGIWPLLFLLFGGTSLTLGLLLFFFSEEGKVVLEWNAHYWFLYCLAAIPLLMFGCRFLNIPKRYD